MKILIKLWITITAILAATAVLGASWFMLTYWEEYHIGAASYQHLSEIATPRVPDSPDEEQITTDTAPIDFDSLRKINPDIVGWIYIPDTRINYPVVKRLSDNDYYLDHLFDGTGNKSGCIFLDTRCNLGDPHVLIHGHNMANGTMFRDLNLFKNRAFFLEHPTILLLTPTEGYVLELFAGSIVRINSPVWQLLFSDESDHEQWLSACWNAASVRRSLHLDADDKIVTLSTCTYEYTQARWIVQGKLRKADASDAWLIRDLMESMNSTSPGE